ncbi:hypothetical protein Droror1_Dr00027871 [Drosera rotundifolia]
MAPDNNRGWKNRFILVAQISKGSWPFTLQWVEDFNPKKYKKPKMNQAEASVFQKIMDWKEEPDSKLFTVAILYEESNLVHHSFAPAPALEMDEPAVPREVRQKKKSDTVTVSWVREPALKLDKLAATHEA